MSSRRSRSGAARRSFSAGGARAAGPGVSGASPARAASASASIPPAPAVPVPGDPGPAVASPVGRLRGILSDDRGRFAATMVVLALIATAALTYLAIEKLTNSNPVCFIVQGCDQVQASRYSTFMGIPVSLFGLGDVLLVLAAVVAWWRTGDGRLLYVPYGLGLIGVFVIAWLVYLELFVIHAVCIWCTTAGASIILGWLVSIVAVRRFGTAR